MVVSVGAEVNESVTREVTEDTIVKDGVDVTDAKGEEDGVV